MTTIDYTKITDNPEVIKLLKEREIIEAKIRELDNMALIEYEVLALQLTNNLPDNLN